MITVLLGNKLLAPKNKRARVYFLPDVQYHINEKSNVEVTETTNVRLVVPKANAAIRCSCAETWFGSEAFDKMTIVMVLTTVLA